LRLDSNAISPNQQASQPTLFKMGALSITNKYGRESFMQKERLLK
jgi:hypothetical protein